MIIRAAIGSKKINPVPLAVPIGHTDEGIVDTRHLDEGRIDFVQHLKYRRHALADILRDSPELGKIHILGLQRAAGETVNRRAILTL